MTSRGQSNRGKNRGHAVNGQSLSETAQIIINKVEEFLGDSKEDVIRGSKEAGEIINAYVKQHPYMSTSTALVVGAIVVLLLKNRSPHLSWLAQAGKHFKEDIDRRSLVEDSTGHVEDILRNVTEEIKKHSLSICDAIIANYVRRNPILATGAALGVGLLLTLLSRR